MNLNNYPLWTAVITPMNENGSVDYPSLEKVLKEQKEAQNGLLILGSTGESLNLDLDEKKEILNFTLSLELELPIMVGVGGANLKTTSSWIEYLETLKVDSYLLVTPLYAKPGVIGQYEWFKHLMDLSTKPVVLYNVPGRTSKELEHQTVQMLKDHPRMWGIKEASGSVEEFKKYVNDAPNALVFSGDDALLPAFSKVGAKGLISVASNVWPKETNLYTKKCLDKSLKDEDCKLWEKASDSLFIASNPIPVKRLMSDLNIITSSVLRAPLTHKDLEDASELQNSHNKIISWFEKSFK